MTAKWFAARVRDGEIELSDLRDPLAFVLQDAEQVREIIAKLEKALEELGG